MVGRQEFVKSLISALINGRRIILYGPIGAGKSTILHAIAEQLGGIDYPCGMAPRTATLSDITEALHRAFPDVNAEGWTKRRTRNHLSGIVEDQGAALLLDHFQDLGTASKGFLRSLWTSRAGILVAVDVEFPRDAKCFNALKMTDVKIEVPRLDARSMRKIFEITIQESRLPRPLLQKEWQSLLQIAAGRPGWIRLMGLKIADARYWREGSLQTGFLRIDISSEIAEQYLGDSFTNHAQRGLS